MLVLPPLAMAYSLEAYPGQKGSWEPTLVTVTVTDSQPQWWQTKIYDGKQEKSTSWIGSTSGEDNQRRHLWISILLLSPTGYELMVHVTFKAQVSVQTNQGTSHKYFLHGAAFQRLDLNWNYCFENVVQGVKFMLISRREFNPGLKILQNRWWTTGGKKNWQSSRLSPPLPWS